VMPLYAAMSRSSRSPGRSKVARPFSPCAFYKTISDSYSYSCAWQAR
jgi:hypothetical protein